MILSKKVINKYGPMVPWILLSISFIIIIFLSIEVYNLKKNPDKIAQNEIKALVNEVKTLIVLPTDELPTVATINDIESLKASNKESGIFDNAQNGDKILIYSKAKTVVVFDPIRKIIINVAPINFLKENS